MTKLEANRKAFELWGDAWAWQRSDNDRALRFVVGITIDGQGFPLGAGDSYEAAFASAEASGFTADDVKRIRADAGVIVAADEQRKADVAAVRDVAWDEFTHPPADEFISDENEEPA